MLSSMFALDKFRNGNKEVWDWVFLEYDIPFQAHVRYRTGDDVFAKDLVQEAFLKLWLKRDKIESLEHMESYLKQIIKNNITDYHRSKAKLEKLKNHLLEVLLQLEKNDDKKVEMDVNSLAFTLAYQKLSTREQQIILLTLKRKSPREIARLLNVSVNTIKSHKYKAKKLLKTELRKIFRK